MQRRIASRPAFVAAFVGLTSAAGLLAIGSRSARADDTPAATVIVQRVGKQCFASLVNANGYVMPRTPAVVMFNVPNFRITEVLVKEGDTIRRGDHVATAAGVAPLGQAQGQGQAGNSTAPTTVPIKSLVTGMIIKSNVAVGQLASAKSDPLFTVAVDGAFEVGADILNIHLPALRAGETARVTLPDGQVLAGSVRRAPVRVDQASQFGQARITFDRVAPRGVGQFVHVAIETSRSCGVGVPRAALSQSSEGSLVQVVDRGAIATRALRLGLSNDTETEVLSGVREGELVVADAGTSLRDGDKVRPVFADLQDAQ